MNNLSWLIYSADVVESLGTTLSLLGALILILGFAFLVIFLIDKDDHYDTENYHQATLYPYRNLWAYGAAAIIVSSFFPSANTVYAIAVSEAGEEVMNSEVGGKAIEALENWIEAQIEGGEEE